MQVQEAERAFVARFVFNIRDLKHVLEIEDVGIEMHTIHTIRDRVRKVR